MKKIIFAVMCVLALGSCSPSFKGIEKDSYECLKEVIGGYPKVEKWKMEPPVTVYKDDSLCISRVNCHFTNLIGEERDLTEEFVYMLSDGKAYHSLRATDEDSVYVSREELAEIQKHTIYRKEGYEGALRYRAVEMLNRSSEYNIPSPLGTGEWQLGEHKDNFGEPNGKFFMFVIGEGTCSGREMKPVLYQFDAFAFKFFDSMGGNAVDIEEYITLNIKDEKGNITEVKTLAIRGGYLAVLTESEEVFTKIVESGGKKTFQFNNITRYSNDNCVFTLNLDGYKKTLEIMN